MGYRQRSHCSPLAAAIQGTTTIESILHVSEIFRERFRPVSVCRFSLQIPADAARRRLASWCTHARDSERFPPRGATFHGLSLTQDGDAMAQRCHRQQVVRYIKDAMCNSRLSRANSARISDWVITSSELVGSWASHRSRPPGQIRKHKKEAQAREPTPAIR